MTAIAEALADYAPELAEEIERTIRAHFDRAIKKFGPALRGIHNSAQGVAMLRVFGDVADRSGNLYSDPYSLNEAKLAAKVEACVSDLLAKWSAKIEEKVGDVEAAEVAKLTGRAFRISGTRAGQRVEIRQDMIINFSGRGLPFPQFPARIKLDGKPISAAAYAQAA